MSVYKNWKPFTDWFDTQRGKTWEGLLVCPLDLKKKKLKKQLLFGSELPSRGGGGNWSAETKKVKKKHIFSNKFKLNSHNLESKIIRRSVLVKLWRLFLIIALIKTLI